MHIVSLLPSLTELVCALGRRDDLVGVTHECDYPPGVEALPHLTRSRIPPAATSAEIDALVSQEKGSLYELDADVLASLRPDLILTQEQCDVCAVNEATVRRVAGGLPGSPPVESVNPIDLEDVAAMFLRVGELLGLDARRRAASLVDDYQTSLRQVCVRRPSGPRPVTLLLEWLDPPFTAGHWNPQIIEDAGGVEPLGELREKSRRTDWGQIASAAPEVVIVAPCGFNLERTRAELDTVASRPEWRGLPAVRNGRVVLADGSAYFSRPGPRLEVSLRIAAAAIHPETCSDLAPEVGWERLGD